MGCLNAGQGFGHWFGNIHLTGPCNRACYFCIGQHMMALDPLNNLKDWPLKNIDKFVADCQEHGVKTIYVTGSNTDPLLYQHTIALRDYLKARIPGLTFGLRTNGVLALSKPETMACYDKMSITICSFNPDIYRAMMGKGSPPDLRAILDAVPHMNGDVKINIVLGPENLANNAEDLLNTIRVCNELGIRRINVREPYGQPHIGDPFAQLGMVSSKEVLGMPVYEFNCTQVLYWDVHYVEVESVNLYANGNVSITYPISKGHDPETGKVLDQSHFPGGRVQEQWLSIGEPRRRTAA